MFRRPLIWLIVSALLVLALAALWVRSYYMVSAFAEYSPSARRWVGVARGELIYDSYTDASFSDSSEGWRWLNYRVTSVKRGVDFPRVLGFSFGRPRREAELQAPQPVNRHFVSIPLWFITASAIAILWRGWRVMTRRTRRESPALARTNDPVPPVRT